jgi:hypothetical protein
MASAMESERVLREFWEVDGRAGSSFLREALAKGHAHRADWTIEVTLNQFSVYLDFAAGVACIVDDTDDPGIASAEMALDDFERKLDALG